MKQTKLHFALLLALVMMVMCPAKTWAEKKAKAVLAGNTLTFYYDENTYKNKNTTQFDLNTTNNYPGWYQNKYRKDITKVVFDSSFADARPTSCYHWFSQISNLSSISGFEYLNTSEVTNMEGMFYGCTNLTSLTLGYFDMQKVTKTTSMFYNTVSLKTLTLKALPYLINETFDTKFSGNGVTVNYILDDNSLVYVPTSDKPNYLPAPTSAPTYSRNVSAATDWGTVVLPFEIKTDDNVQLYKLDGVTSDVMIFLEVETVAANMPSAFMKKTEDATSVTFTASENAISVATPATPEAVGGLAIRGTYTQLSNQTGKYYIAQNKFWYADEAITIPSYRAWFEGSRQNASFRIEVADDAEGISAVRSEEVDVRSGFDLQGRKTDNPKGLFIMNGRVVLLK